ncbi:MAG: hypothetical protein LUD47_01515 [Clostridia bacterium]|nr:hypothetical protein [Clostridia bacterium]
MRKDLTKLIEIAKKHADIIEETKNGTSAADAETITGDVEEVLCGEFGLGSDALLSKAAKKLGVVALPPGDGWAFGEKIGKLSSDEAGSLYVSVWRGAMAEGNPLSDNNRGVLLEILGALGSAVFREVKKLLLIVDGDYVALGDVLLLRRGRRRGIDTSCDFDKLIKTDADRMCRDFGFFSDGLIDAFEKEVLGGRKLGSMTTEETRGLLSHVMGLEFAGTLYVGVLREASCDVSLLDDGRIALLKKNLAGIANAAESVYMSSRVFVAERAVEGMTSDEMRDYLKKEGRMVNKAYRRTYARRNDDTIHIFDETDYMFAFELARDKLRVCDRYADRRIDEIRESGENPDGIYVWCDVIDSFSGLLHEFEYMRSPY